jgi:hypothetical protein
VGRLNQPILKPPALPVVPAGFLHQSALNQSADTRSDRSLPDARQSSEFVLTRAGRTIRAGQTMQHDQQPQFAGRKLVVHDDVFEVHAAALFFIVKP